MNPEEMAAHILKNYDQITEPEAMRDAIAHAIRQHSDPLAALCSILSDPVNQLEVTKMGYYIYRFDLETMHQIADALGVPKAERVDLMPCYTLEELGQLIKPD